MDAFEARVEHVRRLLAGAIDLAVRDFENRVGDNGFEVSGVGDSVVHFVHCECGGGAKGDDAGNVGGATTASHFLSAPEEERLEVDLFLVEEADAFGAIKFVSAGRDVVDTASVGGEFSGGLRDVDEQVSALGSAADFLGVEDGADFVVDRHEGDDIETFGEALFERREDGEAVTFCELDDAAVLVGRDRDFAFFVVTQHPVVPFAGAAKERDLRWIFGLDKGGDAFPCKINGSFCFLTVMVDRGGVARKLGEVRKHFSNDPGVNRRRCRVVEISLVHGSIMGDFVLYTSEWREVICDKAR